jgi:hypothetical protein
MHDDGLVQPSAAVRLHLDGSIFAQVEDWRRSQPRIPSRAEAVRLLVEYALAGPDTPRPPECGRQLNTPSRVASNSVLRPPSSP